MSATPHPEALEPIVLEPCQFCTSTKIEVQKAAKSPPRTLSFDYWIGCRGCGASGPVAGSPELAAQFWNLGKPEPREEGGDRP